MMMRLNAVATLGGLLLLGACATSPPMHFYTLAEMSPETPVTASPGVLPVRIGQVTVPGELDRPALVRRVDETRLEISEQDRWAAPVEEMIARVLYLDLTARLPPGAVADPNGPSGGEQRQLLSVDVQEFYFTGDCAVRLKATWVLRQPDRRTSQTNEDIRLPSGEACSGTASVPAQMSRALAQLSDRIAAGIASPK
jgi:uncharacterized lipoprotein YmbA